MERKLIFILSVDKNWAIGNKNNLLVRIPGDMKNFRRITTDNVIVMGRKTLESFPQGQPLPNRVNLVMSKNASYQVKGTITLTSIEALFKELEKYPDKEVYVVGGGSIYKQLLPYCDKAIITKIDEAYEADTYFTNLDELPDWKITEESEEQTYFDICYTFATYERISKS